MKQHLFFGETVEGYQIPVINEREARAASRDSFCVWGDLFF